MTTPWVIHGSWSNQRLLFRAKTVPLLGGMTGTVQFFLDKQNAKRTSSSSASNSSCFVSMSAWVAITLPSWLGGGGGCCWFILSFLWDKRGRAVWGVFVLNAERDWCNQKILRDATSFKARFVPTSIRGKGGSINQRRRKKNEVIPFFPRPEMKNASLFFCLCRVVCSTVNDGVQNATVVRKFQSAVQYVHETTYCKYSSYCTVHGITVQKRKRE